MEGGGETGGDIFWERRERRRKGEEEKSRRVVWRKNTGKMNKRRKEEKKKEEDKKEEEEEEKVEGRSTKSEKVTKPEVVDRECGYSDKHLEYLLLGGYVRTILQAFSGVDNCEIVDPSLSKLRYVLRQLGSPSPP
ncbi:hypothetical protein M8J77_022323 [Diaphorina citri]|nr:hypothetical protein M8J77_022323 [Diaphorina citri]